MRAKHPQAIRLLFTGYADMDSIIAAINQGHVYRFLKKPWRPDELEAAVRAAAAEYDRLVEQADALQSLSDEVQKLRGRVAALEEEVQALQGE